ncbi:ABC transporter permease, partial [Eggerthella lenta]|nr:ABC transporter permease [Eggerthella lenta]
WFVVPYALWIVLFVVAPLVLILYQSFFNINGQFTFGNYQSYLTSNVYLRMTFNSVWYAFLITLITLLISYPAAYVINR